MTDHVNTINYKNYNPETLLNKFKNAVWVDNSITIKTEDEFVGSIDIKAFSGDAGTYVENFLKILYKIDYFVQPNKSEFSIAFIDVYSDKFMIEYWGNMVNTQFDVHIQKNAQGYFCLKVGLKAYDTPILISE